MWWNIGPHLQRRIISNQKPSAGLAPRTLDGLKDVLNRKFGSVARAWRICMDTDESGSLNFREFVLALKAVGYVGDFRSLWFQLDADQSGSISLKELDPEATAHLEKFRHKCIGKCGTMEKAWRKVIDTDKSGTCGPHEFMEACFRLGYSNIEEINTLFFLLDLDNSETISLEKITFLQNWEKEKLNDAFRERLPTRWVNKDPYMKDDLDKEVAVWTARNPHVTPRGFEKGKKEQVVVGRSNPDGQVGSRRGSRPVSVGAAPTGVPGPISAWEKDGQGAGQASRPTTPGLPKEAPGAGQTSRPTTPGLPSPMSKASDGFAASQGSRPNTPGGLPSRPGTKNSAPETASKEQPDTISRPTSTAPSPVKRASTMSVASTISAQSSPKSPPEPRRKSAGPVLRRGSTTDYSGPAGSDHKKQWEQFQKHLASKYGTLAKAFDVMDANSNGSLSLVEFQSVVCGVLQYCRASDAKRLFVYASPDQPCITWKELGVSSQEWVEHLHNKRQAAIKRMTEGPYGKSKRNEAAVLEHIRRAKSPDPTTPLAFQMPLPKGWGFPPHFDPKNAPPPEAFNHARPKSALA